MIVRCFRVNKETKILRMADFGDILMDFDVKSKKEKNFETLKQDVKSLKRKRDALLDREVKIRNDLNSGTVQNASNYRLPLSVLPVQNLSQKQVYILSNSRDR